MGSMSEWGRDDDAREAPTVVCPPRCPVCSGALVELRGNLRCGRCHYTFCEGCGGDREPDSGR